MKPIDAKTTKQIAGLPRDNFPASIAKWTALLSEDEVYLSAPRGAGGFSIPRDQFDVIVKWYMGIVP